LAQGRDLSRGLGLLLLVARVLGKVPQHLGVVQAAPEILDPTDLALYGGQPARDLLRLVRVVPQVGRRGLLLERRRLGVELAQVGNGLEAGLRGGELFELGGDVGHVRSRYLLGRRSRPVAARSSAMILKFWLVLDHKSKITGSVVRSSGRSRANVSTRVRMRRRTRRRRRRTCHRPSSTQRPPSCARQVPLRAPGAPTRRSRGVAGSTDACRNRAEAQPGCVPSHCRRARMPTGQMPSAPLQRGNTGDWPALPPCPP